MVFSASLELFRHFFLFYLTYAYYKFRGGLSFSGELGKANFSQSEHYCIKVTTDAE